MGVKMIKKKDSPYWYVSIHKDGRRTSRMCGKHLTLKRRNEIVGEYEHRLAMGTIDWPEKLNGNGERVSQHPEFGRFALAYLKDYAKGRLKRNTFERYRGIIKQHLLPVWQHQFLDDISKADIRSLLLDKQKAGLTVGNIKICISAIFQHAVEMDVLKANPCRSLGKLPTPEKEAEANGLEVLTAKQVVQLLAVSEELRDFWLLFVRSGIRLGEGLGLCWDAVDLDGRQVCIKRTYNHHRWSSPKSKNVRYIDLSEALEAALQRRDKARSGQVCKTDSGVEVELVFPDKAGKPMDTDKVRRRFYKTLKAAGLPKIKIHSLRHTFASLMLGMGCPIFYVSRMLGHKDISTTCNIYGHLLEGENRKFMDMLDSE